MTVTHPSVPIEQPANDRATSAPARRPHKFYIGALILLTLIMSLPGIAALPVIDRDEARYAQASVQMIESGDYLNIRFQDEARNKKPAGIYWLQAASVKIVSSPEKRQIWANRIPSVLGALLAVLSTYWAGVMIVGRRGGFWAAGLLACSLLMTFESHIAKTDAVLCGFSALILTMLIRLRAGPDGRAAFILWAALGASVMIKGPIAPTLFVLTVLALTLWERGGSWQKNLISWPGILAAVLLTVPWAIAIGMATDGAFFKEAIGGDLAPKLMGGQEKHGAPPGTYILTLPLFFWPASLFLICAGVFTLRALKAKDENSARLKSHVRLLLCWIVPFWFLLELAPTKLSNYLLPVYPALCLLCGGAVLTMINVPGALSKSLKAGAAIYIFITLALIGGMYSAWAAYAPQINIWLQALIPVFILAAFAVVYYCFKGRIERALICGLALAATFSAASYHFFLPSMQDLRVSDQIHDSLKVAGIQTPGYSGRILSPFYTEPSLVYRLGTDILLGDKAQAQIEAGLAAGDVLIIDTLEAGDEVNPITLAAHITDSGQCLKPAGEVKGMNYSKGDKVDIDLYQLAGCETLEGSLLNDSKP